MHYRSSCAADGIHETSTIWVGWMFELTELSRLADGKNYLFEDVISDLKFTTATHGHTPACSASG